MVAGKSWRFTTLFDYVTLECVVWFDNCRCHTNILHRLQRRRHPRRLRMESVAVQGGRDAICVLRNQGRLHRRDPVPRRPASDLAVVAVARGQG